MQTPNSNPTPSNPPYPSYKGEEKGGFAFPTVNTRWPVILTGIIDEVHRRMASTSSTSMASLMSFLQLPQMETGNDPEAKEIIGRMGALKYEVWRAKAVRLIEDDAGDDLEIWNESVRTHFSESTSTLLHGYGLNATCFHLSSSWKNYDPFLVQKIQAFHGSLDDVINLSTRLADSLHINDMVFFRELVLLSLWGNATDLSMFAGMDQSDIANMKAGAGESNIISNDLDALCEYVSGMNDARVDFILDNSGFEFFSDLLLADHLHQIGRAKRTVFHLKSMPWFVSDTNHHDVEWLLKSLESPEDFFTALRSSPRFINVDFATLLLPLKTLAARWRQYITSGNWVFTDHRFWTTGWAYHHLPTEAPELWQQLSESALLIFKGDLNYRKLAIGAMAGDPCVGIASGKADLLDTKDPDWRWNGKFAVVSFCQRLAEA
ncbi:hypothetical protein BC829DRAFT_425100 [Chytridium lagenaria]|nr:hypothetical protein BC829DRAFT_425100 [Chytridium lagenaria]